jgi:PiT family inorganic phosphate transporter
MNAFLEEGLSGGSIALLFLCLAIAFGFEFANGFHDTANAVATVIYTHSLKPRIAVLISGACNFTGVVLSGIGVALAILKLLPVELLVSSGAGAGLAMVLALLISAILWNVGTWYFGLPASSSHTLIGAIIGVGLANSALPGHHFGDGVNWSKAEDVGLSLFLSPVIGFSLAAILLLLIKVFFKKYPQLFEPPPKDKAPPFFIRALLTLTCGGVSYSHGSNDGQKGVGIVMLILMGLVPAGFALNHDATSATIDHTIEASVALAATVHDHADASAVADADKATEELAQVRSRLAGKTAVTDIAHDQRFQVRQAILLADKSIDTMVKGKKLKLSDDETHKLKKDREALRALTDYAPKWVLIAIAIALGVGTMVGWKRIVVTVGEKIGKSHLTYAQGASAELVAMCTIGLASSFGLPVSTTHVLSSGIAGTMVAQKSGLQRSTVQSIALAWVLTLPVAMVLAAGLFLGLRAALPGGSPATTPHVVTVPDNEEPPPPAVAEQDLHLGGSNTIGEQLAPRLAKAFLVHQGAESVTVDGKDAATHRVVVHGALGGKPIRVEIVAPGSKIAFECLESGACDVGMSSRSIHEDEVTKLQALGDMTQPASEHILGQDGVAVIVNRANPVTMLTFADLAKIFTGAVSDWSAVGGPAGPIKVYARDTASGTYDVFSSLVARGAPLKPTTSFDDSEALSRAVSTDPAAIGFIGLPYVKDAKAIAVKEGDAQALYPTVFTVATEDYPLTRRLYLYSDDDPKNPLASAFIGFAQSDEGQRLVEESGFVSLAVRAEKPPAPPGAPERYTSELAGASRLSVDFRFRAGGAELDTKAVRDLDRVVAYLAMPENRTRQVLLIGFANEGQESANEALSRLRADALAKQLAQRGVVPAVIDGFGSALPIAPSTTPEGRERNRRVEVWVR